MALNAMKMAKSMQSISAPVLIILISACSVRVALPLMRCVSLHSTIESEAREEGPIDSAPAADKIKCIAAKLLCDQNAMMEKMPVNNGMNNETLRRFTDTKKM